MKTLCIDLETYSSVDLSKCGVYKYAEAYDFEILLFSYSLDGSEVNVIDLANGEKIPEEITDAIEDDNVIKCAYNSQFERICLSRYLGLPVGEYLSPYSWECDMIWAASLGLPLSLENVGSVLGLEKQKMSEGKALIKYFCVPCKPTKVNGGRTRNYPHHDMEKWELFKKYNKRDVETEIEIQKKLSKFPVPDFIWDEYHLDQEINDRGILIDMDFVNKALNTDEISRQELNQKMIELTQLENPNSVVQMKKWLAENGHETDTLGKDAVKELLKKASPKLARVLEIRQELAKSSVKKYTAMVSAACSDNRARGLYQFYGANRTGRTSGRLIQFQNLPQNHISDLKNARELVKTGEFKMLEILYDSVPQVLSELIRTAFIPPKNKKYIVADFSAVEARVLAWFAGEKWVMDVFANNGDIYCATASKMFHCNVVKNGENGHLRQKGKQATLSCGYGGSVGALKAMGAIQMGMKEDELKPLVDAWRAANPNIVNLWWDIDEAVKRVIKERSFVKIKGLRIFYQSGMLFIQLPSERKLVYAKPRIGENKFGGESVTYEGIGAAKKWERLESYGPKFVENCVQAIARDLLFYSIKTLRNCSIVGQVHDELIIEADKRMSVDAVCELMSRTPEWAKDLNLKADGYECEFYQKQ